MNLNSWKYRTTNHFFNYLNFHDCFVKKIMVESDTVIIDFKYIFILKTHPLNPFDVPKSTDKCRLTFNRVTMIKPNIYFDDKSEKEVPIVGFNNIFT